jgi:hypothetical protein
MQMPNYDDSELSTRTSLHRHLFVGDANASGIKWCAGLRSSLK